MKNKLLFRILVVLSVVLVLFTASISASASVYVARYPDGYLSLNTPSWSIVQANNSFEIYHNVRSTTDGTYFQDNVLYSAHSEDVLPGYIEASIGDMGALVIDNTTYAYMIEQLNGITSYYVSFLNSSHDRVTAQGSELYLSYPTSAPDVDPPQYEQVVAFEYREAGAVRSTAFPNSLSLQADSIVLNRDILSLYYDGYGGITLYDLNFNYVSSPLTVTYSFVVQSDTTAQQVFTGSYTIVVNSNDQEARIALIDPQLYTLFSEYDDDFFMISDLELNVDICEVSYATELTPYNVTGYRMTTHYPIIAGNNGVSGGYYDNYNVLSDLYLKAVSYQDFGSSDLIEEAYQNGYDDGFEQGYTEGLDEGFNTGASASYDEGYDDGYDVGYNDGYGFGYDTGLNETFEDLDFTNWIGVAVGGFLDKPLFFGTISLGDMLSVIIALTFLILFLKFFAGG